MCDYDNITSNNLEPFSVPFYQLFDFYLDDKWCTMFQGWHTTYATAALSQYIKSRLDGLYDNMVLIDTVGVMRANMGKYECMNHFLCRYRYRFCTTCSKTLFASIL